MNSGVESFQAVDQDQLWSVICLLNVTRISSRSGSTSTDPARGVVSTTTGGTLETVGGSDSWGANPSKLVGCHESSSALRQSSDRTSFRWFQGSRRLHSVIVRDAASRCARGRRRLGAAM